MMFKYFAYLSLLGDDYGKELLNQYEKRLHKIFNPTNIMRTGFSLEAEQTVLNDFADICLGFDRLYANLALDISYSAVLVSIIEQSKEPITWN